MAGHTYMQFFPSKGGSALVGDSRTVGYEDWVVISTFTWDAAKNENNVVKPTTFRMTKVPCRASTLLMTALSTGQRFATVNVLIMDHQKYLGHAEGQQVLVTLTDVRAIEYAFSATEEKSAVKLEEDWQFDYQTIEFAFGSKSNATTLVNSGPPEKAMNADEKKKAEGKTTTTPGAEKGKERERLSLSHESDYASRDNHGGFTVRRRS